jgi:hypothetical protein
MTLVKSGDKLIRELTGLPFVDARVDLKQGGHGMDLLNSLAERFIGDAVI